jgi:hypothetical protein
MTQDFDLQAFQEEVNRELRKLHAQPAREEEVLLRRLVSLWDPSNRKPNSPISQEKQNNDQLLMNLLGIEPDKQAILPSKPLSSLAHRFVKQSAAPSYEETMPAQQADQLLARKDIRAVLCPALQSVGNDSYEIAKIITPILCGVAIAGTITIPLVPILFASAALLISRMGIAGLCAEYNKKAKEVGKDKE